MAEDERDQSAEYRHRVPHPTDQPVDVFETMQETEAWVVRGLLEEAAGIEAVVIAPEAAADVLPGVGGYVVRVPQEDAEDAQRLIAESRVLAGESEDTSDEGAA
jgi:hypothetical protein